MNEYMKVADELARDNLVTNVGGPFGAVVVKDIPKKCTAVGSPAKPIKFFE